MEVEYEFVETQFTNQEREARGNIIQLFGTIQNVVGDGSCFIYAVMLGMKQLDHRAGMCPSARDLQVQQQLRERIAQWWIDHPTIVDIDAVNGHGDLITRPQRSTHVVLLMSLMHISSSPDPYGHGSTDMHACNERYHVDTAMGEKHQAYSICEAHP